jgi:GDPmannose 4,6-dehydratase
VIRKFEALCGIAIQIETDPGRLRSNEVAQILGDATKIRRETGWSPQIPLEKMLRDLMDYWLEKVKRGSSAEAPRKNE